ncbi:hypothetical protein VY88_19955 [Azospirillum thiophilum]|uniref:Mandelate racemase n=1 Tax=Azospirillum thiophilum TaxID=528244 RepID=A0AAC8W3F9_9PROT|nr:hypothetical protein [Azospirillum thiophilum]ALG74388.1 hypothetical protein AL072_22960 [Azospirillum thiophilum]KJR63742.1 hypothetical protein VY88_19955 [Azospirillum thiophilum]
MSAPRLRIRAIELYERPVRFVKPFRFGAVTVEAAPQSFVRALVALEGQREAWGAAAEMMMPKWFDKRPDRSPADTVDGLRRSLIEARDAYLSDSRLDTAFGHHAAFSPTLEPKLAAAFGPAQIDKAVLDGLLRVLGLNAFQGLGANAAGLDARLAPDLAGFGLDGFLNGLSPLPAVELRHTVGLLDAADALPALLEHSALRWFKIKLGGDVDADIGRLCELAAVLEVAAPGYRATLDGNEQYRDAGHVAELLDRMDAAPELAGFRRALAYLEQPIAREAALARPLGAVAERVPVIIDESDDGYDAFPRARAMGYRGVSSKSCKGLYKAILNRARCAAWGPPHFISAEDLTCQAGLSVQQDTALVAFLGIPHAERNGHQYGGGFAGEAEGAAFLAAHPGFYTRDTDSDGGGTVRLATGSGRLETASLHGPGFAHACDPDWSGLSPLSNPTSALFQGVHP